MNDTERSLATSARGEPLPDLEARVMSAVRREARVPPPIPFPWRRLALGTLAAVAVVAATLAVAAYGGNAAALVGAAASNWIGALAGGVLVSALGLRWCKLAASA